MPFSFLKENPCVFSIFIEPQHGTEFIKERSLGILATQVSSQGLLLFFYLRSKTALLIEATVAGGRYKEEILARKVSTLGILLQPILGYLRQSASFSPLFHDLQQAQVTSSFFRWGDVDSRSQIPSPGHER